MAVANNTNYQTIGAGYWYIDSGAGGEIGQSKHENEIIDNTSFII